MDGVKLRLENWEEGDYRVDDQPKARGEMIIGSNMVSDGYKREEDTDEAFFEENGIRWWRSDDIGRTKRFFFSKRTWQQSVFEFSNLSNCLIFLISSFFNAHHKLRSTSMDR